MVFTQTDRDELQAQKILEKVSMDAIQLERNRILNIINIYGNTLDKNIKEHPNRPVKSQLSKFKDLLNALSVAIKDGELK